MINTEFLLVFQQIGRLSWNLKGLDQSRMNSRIIISISINVFLVNNIWEVESSEYLIRCIFLLQDVFSLIIIIKSSTISMKHVRDNLTVCQQVEQVQNPIMIRLSRARILVHSMWNILSNGNRMKKRGIRLSR